MPLWIVSIVSSSLRELIASASAPVIRKKLFHNKSRCYLITLVHVFVGDKPIHLGPQCNGFQHRGYDHLKQVVMILRVFRVLCLQVFVYVGQVDALRKNASLSQRFGYSTALKMHGIQIPQKRTVPPVSNPFPICSFLSFPFLRFYGNKDSKETAFPNSLSLCQP